jgi:hypothetical protein
MLIDRLCAPEILFIIVSFFQLTFDLYNGLYKIGLIKLLIFILLSILINILCYFGLYVVAWILFFIIVVVLLIVNKLTLDYFNNNLEDNLEEEVDNFNLNSYIEVDRIDRDKIREDLYDDIEEYYDLSSSNVNMNDLSNNTLKYSLVDSFLNIFGENNFRLYINNYLNNIRTSNNRNNNENTNYRTFNSIINNSHPSLYNYNRNINTPSDMSIYKNLPNTYVENNIRQYKRNEDTHTNYNDYQDDLLTGYSNLDGFFSYKDNYYDSIKNELKSTDTNVTDIEIDKEIQRRWEALSSNDKDYWNNRAEEEPTDKDSLVYDVDNQPINSFNRLFFNHKKRFYNNKNSKSVTELNPCPINENSGEYKSRTGKDCYNACPPGQERNCFGICVRSCGASRPDYSRRTMNSNCRRISDLNCP